MLHDIHVFLYGHRWAVLVVTAIVVAIYARILLAHLRAPARDERRMPQRPAGKPTAKFAETVRGEDIPSPEVGAAPPLAKSRAPTNRMAPVTVGDPAAKAAESDDAAMSDLFAGLDDSAAAKQAPTATSAKTQEPKTDGQRRAITETGAIRLVGRMEELGFHHSIDCDPIKPGVAPSAPAASTAGDGTTRAEAKAVPESKPAAAELDAILARIDQVLSQDGKKTEVADAPAAKPDARTRPTEMMPPSAQPADPRTKQTQVLSPPEGEAKDAKKAPPLWARADAFDEDADKADAKKPDAGTQLGLFDDKK